MQTQTVEFAITHNKGNITRVGKASIPQPKIYFRGGSVRWHKDKLKSGNR